MQRGTVAPRAYLRRRRLLGCRFHYAKIVQDAVALCATSLADSHIYDKGARAAVEKFGRLAIHLFVDVFVAVPDGANPSCGAGDRDRTGDIQLGKLPLSIGRDSSICEMIENRDSSNRQNKCCKRRKAC